MSTFKFNVNTTVWYDDMSDDTMSGSYIITDRYTIDDENYYEIESIESLDDDVHTISDVSEDELTED
jgi:hypothetical protein